MPTVEQNKASWDGKYNWRNSGDEWSASWGGTSMQWHGSILPRIHTFVPAKTILEIACGYGRWTQFLKNLCGELIVIDLSESCIRACRQRFSDCAHISYFTNDGKSLDMVDDNHVDFLFSFDSLVHADESVLEAYIAQLPRILKADGAAFIHHSNLQEYSYYLRIQKIPKLRGLLTKLGILENVDCSWRDWTVSAGKVERYAEAYGLRCISQEVMTWGTRKAMTDCLSIIVKKDSPLCRANIVFRNSGFEREIRYLSRLSEQYSRILAK
jgi:ubiquinone/menaquinone biosynthesis C-methylase UbiE